jgi:hypothetical protein
MTEQTWEVHKERHPETAEHFPTQVEQTVKNPSGYRQSTADYAKDDTVAFERTISGTNTTLRVIVQYDATTFLQGNTSGKMTSVYVPASYQVGQTNPVGRLGPFISLIPPEGAK